MMKIAVTHIWVYDLYSTIEEMHGIDLLYMNLNTVTIQQTYISKRMPHFRPTFPNFPII